MPRSEEKGPSYPLIPRGGWWELRKAFQRTIPGKVDTGYLSATLDVGDKAARNLIPALRAVGLVDQDGKPTKLAVKWRDDDQYAEACATILEDVYPSSLRDALPPPDPDGARVVKWFKGTTALGDTAVRKAANVYLLLCRADPAEGTAQLTARAAPKGESTRRAGQRRQPSAPEGQEAPPAEASDQPDQKTGVPPPDHRVVPSLHIDIQIHIDPSAPPDQIDRIFESMARHLALKRE